MQNLRFALTTRSCWRAYDDECEGCRCSGRAISPTCTDRMPGDRQHLGPECFTREVRRSTRRYREISAHLDQVRLPFTVDFQYLDRGIRIGGRWFPALKMRWVEGLGLNQFVEDRSTGPNCSANCWTCGRSWPGGCARPAWPTPTCSTATSCWCPCSGGQLALKLIDYDGMYVPSLAGRPSGEVGHPAYQHPHRLREGTYSGEVDRFSHLAIYCAVRCLKVGRRELWQRFNNGDNLLFRESDFRNPGESELFRTLWELPDRGRPGVGGSIGVGLRNTAGRSAAAGRGCCQRRRKGGAARRPPRAAVRAVLESKPKPKPPPIEKTSSVPPLPAITEPIAGQSGGSLALSMAAGKPLGDADGVHPPEPPVLDPNATAPPEVNEEMRSWVNWWLLIFLFGLFLKASGSFLKATGSLLRARTRDLFLFFLHLPSLVLRSVVNSLHTADRSLLSLVGEDNTILHSFLRLIVCMALVVAAWIVSQAFYSAFGSNME